MTAYESPYFWSTLMAKTSKPTFQKREKEKARAQKQRDKGARKAERRARRSESIPRVDGEDPDLAGIVPGPQPLPPEFGRHED